MVTMISLHNQLLLLLLLLVGSGSAAGRRKRLRILRCFRKLRSWDYDLTMIVFATNIIVCSAYISLMELLFNSHIVAIHG